MADSQRKINELQARLDKLVEYQDYFYRETNYLREELKKLRTDNQPSAKSPIVEESTPQIETTAESFPRQPIAEKPRPEQKTTAGAPNYQTAQPRQSSGIEEFVGKNLFSLIGIIITIIGVGIGAKYAIDRDLISPVTRIGLGYAFAGVLSAVAFWLKSKYLNFSAVLLSGALAMAYFLTFFAYSFYGLIPQTVSFVLMLLITAFTVAAALSFNRQVIAHIGLVGAYAVPFLLSDNSGRVGILFTYMAIINFGILLISIKKFWKSLFYTSFIFTWLIYAVLFLFSYRGAENFTLFLVFATIFFLTFYATFLVYKLLAKEDFSAEIVALVFVNSFIFYGFGYAILNSRENTDALLGLFTVANALLNAVVAFVIHRYNLGDRKNFYLAVTLAVTFLTIAVPVQFEGNWVTLVWTAEAATLFWFGRTKRLGVYENLSYVLMPLATISFLKDWQNAFDDQAFVTPLFNENFLTSILFAVAFGFITFVNRDKSYQTANESIRRLLSFAAPFVFLFVLYNAFRVEIGNYFHSQMLTTAIPDYPSGDALNSRKDYNINYFNIVWQINYTMFFLTFLSFINIKRIKSAWFGLINVGLNSAALIGFLSVGLYLISELRESWLKQLDGDLFQRGAYHIFIRYISLAFVVALIYASFVYVKQKFFDELIANSILNFAFDLVFYTALWWLLSSELINLLNVFGIEDSYKLGLSILWGIYSVFLIVVGIVKRKAHLRIGAIVLFAATLVKLFLYDIADLDTISKTVIFLTLGILLLIISFLYNKYKDLIFEKSADEKIVESPQSNEGDS